jgi:hypothetical protein
MAGEVSAVALTVLPTYKHLGGSASSRGFDGANDTDTDSIHRRLQTRACGEEIGRVTQGHSWRPLFVYLLDQAGLRFTAKRTNYFTSSLRYDVVAYKVCGSCAETEAMLSEEVLMQIGWSFSILRY